MNPGSEITSLAKQMGKLIEKLKTVEERQNESNALIRELVNARGEHVRTRQEVPASQRNRRTAAKRSSQATIKERLLLAKEYRPRLLSQLSVRQYREG